MQDHIFVGGAGVSGNDPQALLLGYANRHGLITGATGTGKTVTLQILIEGFSAAGVPVFAADVKGDVSGLSQPGETEGKTFEALNNRAETIGLGSYPREAFPAVFWDLFGENGHPIRTTITEMGPLLLAQMLELTETQEGVLNVAFRVADDEGLALLDLDDLRAMLLWLGENAKDVSLRYGNVATSSIGAIQRALLVLENQGASSFFGEPALDLTDMIATDQGRGRVNILMADRLMTSPRLYAMFLLWLLSELFEELPEIGNPDKPVMVFFFDEAHLLFEDAPKALVNRIEQVVRLIRSKGVGVYFVTQAPDDVPEDVLGQLGNRIQHALRAYTPREAKALKAAAETFRANPEFDTETAIREVGTGEAVISLMENKAIPGMVQRTLIRPPASRMGPITAEERRVALGASPVAGKYEEPIDRHSAQEALASRAEAAAAEAEKTEDLFETVNTDQKTYQRARRYDGSGTRKTKGSSRKEQTLGDALTKTMIKQLNSRQGQAMVRGLLGSLFKGR